MSPVEEKAVTEGFKAAGERMTETEKNVEFLKKNIDQILKTLRTYGQAVMTGTLGGQDYQGFWPNDGMARDFGVVVMKALGSLSKDFGTMDNTIGGNLVPDALAAWIIQKLGKYGKFRKNAVRVKMASGTQNVPKITSDLTIYAPGEGGIIERSDVKFGMVGMTAKN
jgi:HK97 family phage major capsid protein